MIIGIGHDITDIARIQSNIDKHGERFTQRCFTNTEIQTAQNRAKNGLEAQTYAKRFAAKEACAKALGLGIDHGIYLTDIGIENDENGAPTLTLTGGALKRLNAITPVGTKAHIHVSLSDEPPIASAYVIIETRNE